MTIYGLDPGTTHSALICLVGDQAGGGIYKNSDLLSRLMADRSMDMLVIEQIEAMGMAVGAETFETVFWSGRFAQAWEPRQWARITRRAVKLYLCGSMRAKDANIRQALIDKWGGIAATKKGGALYGIKSHLWAALAVAVTYRDQHPEALRAIGAIR